MNFEEIQLRARALFRQEAADLLTELEAALLDLERDPANPPAIHRVFRAMHTLKGSGATSGFAELSDFVHRVEDLYNAARENRLQLTSAMIDDTLRIVDAIARYLAAPDASAAAVLIAAQPDLDRLVGQLHPAEARPAASVAAASDPAPEPTVPALTGWKIRFKPVPGFFRTGSDPAVFLDDLRQLGPCEIQALTDDLPPLDRLDPESCYLGWEITLRAAVDEAQIREVFLFVADDCELTLTPLCPAAPQAWRITFQATPRTLETPNVLETLWLDLARLGEVRVLHRPTLVSDAPGPGEWSIELVTTATADDLADVFLFMLDAAPRFTRAEPVVDVPPVVPAPSSVASPAPATAPAPPVDEVLRVSSRKLDQLVNLVGELVILRSQLSDACRLIPSLPPSLQAVGEGLQRITSELRDVVLEVRMMPIGDTFNKFRRLTRDMSRELGKEVELVIEGAATELDKSVLDQLNDPLVHLVRNCLDHGLEPPETRVAGGKPRIGTLRLAAEQKGDRVCITIADDGRGLNADAIRTKALERGLLAPGATPSDNELHQMIFLPGFSTAATVSKVSGRGVGLDVVKRGIERLRGTVELDSRPGHGTEIRLSLPLTLAIIEGLMVAVQGDHYILPLSAARETIEISRADRQRANGRNLVELRGELVPYLRLRELFGLPGDGPPVERAVIVEFEEQRLGIVVDEVIGNHQTVLKSLGWLSHQVRVFSGSTVLGNGRAALILDLAGLVDFVRRQRSAANGFEV